MAWLGPGKRGVVTVYRLDEILAQTDPFDLAQAIERHVCTLDGADIRALVAPALDRAGKYYRDELAFLLNPGLTDSAARKALIRFLTANLRAVMLLGPAFASAVIEACPSNRVVGIGEEGRRRARGRTMLIAGTAIALVILGAAAEHAVTNARAAAQGPQANPPVAVRTRAPAPAKSVGRAHRAPANSSPNPEDTAYAVEAPLRPLRTPGEPIAAYDSQAGSHSAVPAQSAPAPHVRARRVGGPPGKATLTISVTPPPPTPEPTPIGVNDMPQSYSDATPLPAPSGTQTANPIGTEKIVTPRPTEKPRHGWLNHLDPFQPGAHIRIP